MTDQIVKIAQQLILNGLRFQYLKRVGRPGRPQAVSLELTHHCIAKCMMCNIWRVPRDLPHLAVEDWLRLLASNLFGDLRELDLTGGEPFLIHELPDLFEGICDLTLANLTALKSIAITTNGLLTRRVLAVAEKVLPKLEAAKLDLIVVCAMDGIGEIHNRIRNVKDAWQKVNKTIMGLNELRENFPNLIVGLKTTILPLNINELERLVRYADTHGLFTIISPFIITEGRYLNLDLSAEFEFSPQDISRLIQFYRSKLFRWSYHGDTLVDYLESGRIKKPCSCGFNYFFIRSTGELFLCPLIKESVGNIGETAVSELFLSAEASRIRREIGKLPQCRQCTEPGLECYALPYQGFHYLALLLKKGKTEFLQLHQHMGLDKYFDAIN